MENIFDIKWFIGMGQPLLVKLIGTKSLQDMIIDESVSTITTHLDINKHLMMKPKELYLACD